jgi:hypothetical protein
MITNSTSEELQFYPNSVNRPIDTQTEKSDLFHHELKWFGEIYGALVKEQEPYLKPKDGENGLESCVADWGRGSNVIGLLGSRGSGKSSMLLAIRHWLEEKNKEVSEEKKYKSVQISLDPSLIRGHRLATVLLTKLYAGFRKHVEELGCSGKKGEEIELNELHKEFQEVLKGLNGTILPFSADASLQDLLLFTEVTELRVKMFKLIKKHLRLMGNGAEKLVLLLDDFDLEEDTLTGHLDDWWHFLNLPNVVVIISASPMELDELLTIGRMKGRDMLLDKPCKVGVTSESKPGCLDITEMRRRAAAHLLKVMGVNRRVYLASNSASSKANVEVILSGKPGSTENSTYEMLEFLRKYSALDLGIHVLLSSLEEKEKTSEETSTIEEEKKISEETRSREEKKKTSEREKIARLLDVWNHSSLREQMLVMAFLYRSSSLHAAGDSIRVGLRDQFFSSGDLIELERALPRWTDRLAFSANVVRWLVTEKANKPDETLRSLCQNKRIPVQSNWKAFLFINWMWYLLQQDERGSTVMNFFTVESDVDVLFWGGKKWDSINMRMLDAIVDLRSREELKTLFELAKSKIWIDKDGNPKQAIRLNERPINLLNLVPQLLLGTFVEQYDLEKVDTEKLPILHQQYMEWTKDIDKIYAKRKVHEYLQESLSNPIFFASVLMVFPRGGRVDAEKERIEKEVLGVKRFLRTLEIDLVPRVKQLITLRMEGHEGEQGMITKGELDAYFTGHPLAEGKVELSKNVPRALWHSQEGDELILRIQAERKRELSNELKKWKLDRLFLERKQRDLAPADWAERTDAESRRTMKRLLRAIQVRISDKIHSNATEEINQAHVTYPRINDAMRMAEAGDLFQAANVVAVVFTTYIEAISQRVTEIEAQLNQLNRG